MLSGSLCKLKIEAFIIHLERATARRQQVDALAAALPMPANIVDAVDGLTLSDDDIAKVYRRRLHSPRYPFELRKTEIACFLSHRKAWQSILDKGLDAGLIVEDDVAVGPAFGEIVDATKKLVRTTDFVRFPRWDRGENGPETVVGRNMTIMEPRVPGLGMQAQLVGRGAAEALLTFTATFDRPVDTTLQMHWLHSVRVLSARPIAIEEVDHLVGGSVIQNKSKPFGEILSRELRRTAYRLSLKAMALSRR